MMGRAVATNPTIEKDGWELLSAVEENQRDARFQIPDEAERTSLRVGQRVKLLFLMALPPNQPDGATVQCERMWVTVNTAEQQGYTGTLINTPHTSDVLSEGDLIQFRPEHVATVLVPRP